MDDISDFVSVTHKKVVFSNRLCDTEDIGLLEGVTPNEVSRHLPGDGDNGRRVHKSGGETGDKVSSTRATGRDADANFACRTSIAISSMGRCLFMTNQDMMQRGIGRERI